MKDSELRIKFLKFNMKMVIFFFASKNEQDFPKKAHKIPKLKKGSDILEHHLDIWRLMVLLRWFGVSEALYICTNTFIVI